MNIRLQGQRFNAGGLEDSTLRRRGFYHALVESTRQIAGVEQAGAVRVDPMLALRSE